VGNAVATILLPIVAQLNRIEGLQVNFAPIASKYWGQSISVTGVIVGSDIIDVLEGKHLGECVYIPRLMLKYDEDRFLDDSTVSEVAEKLGTKIIPTQDVDDLLDRLLRHTPAATDLRQLSQIDLYDRFNYPDAD
jgi:NifB/MoaA-like Fe-S oxidoreductase